MSQLIQPNKKEYEVPTMKWFGISVTFAALWLCVAGLQVAAQTFTTLLSFDGTDGANSTAGLIRGGWRTREFPPMWVPNPFTVLS